MTPPRVYDVLIIGGGPAGSTAATYLARAGRTVLILEKEFFPRFHIGESLLPYNHALFREMGLLPALEAAGHPVKTGAQFHLGNGSKSLRLVFRRGVFTREPTAFQVERATFDNTLLRHAAHSGAEVREGWTVEKFESAADEITLHARDAEGLAGQFKARFLIDASGRGNLTANQDGLREIYPRHRKVAVFGHFTGVARDEGEAAGDTVIVRLENKWFWLIPIGPDKTSVGCVLDSAEYATRKEDPVTVFNTLVASSPEMAARMTGSKTTVPLQVTQDFSYWNRRLTGHRLLRAGDAAGFMDPIFSAGVYLAMTSGRSAAQAVDHALRSPAKTRGLLARYERSVRRAMDDYWKLVEGFYTTPFMEVLMEPRGRLNIPSAVTALLAGETNGGWRVWWRLQLFHLLVRVQGRWPFLPRIRFDNHGPARRRIVNSV